MRNIFLATVAPVLASAFFAFNHTPNPSTESATLPTLDTCKWNLVKIYSDTGTIDAAGKNAYIRFDEAAGKAGGKGGCNSFGCTITIKDTAIQITNLFSTKMYCLDRQPIENSFFYHLQRVTSYTVHDKKLLLLADDIVVLELQRE